MGIYFYKTGKIHALPVEQKTAIEIGILAISIYNHTLDFAFCDKKAEGSYCSTKERHEGKACRTCVGKCPHGT